MIPSYFLIVGDDLACIANEWCVEIENDINEEHNVHDGVNDQQLHRFLYNCFFEILNIMRRPVMSVILIIENIFM